MKYSIIVPTYNRSQLLSKCLASIARQSVPKSEYEVIVVNDGSTDDTADVLSKFKKENSALNFRFFSQENGGPSKARNLGIKNSNGETIFFTDDDCVVPENWIEYLADTYKRHPDIVGAGGWYIYPKDWPEKYLFARYYGNKTEKIYGNSLTQEFITSDLLKTPVGNTANMSYKKEILDKVGGFDEKIMYPGFDDTELKMRIMEKRYKLLYTPFPVIHRHMFGIKKNIVRIFNFGRGRYYLAKKFPIILQLYNPNIKKLKYLIKQQPTFPLRMIAVFDFLITKLAWEFEKYTITK